MNSHAIISADPLEQDLRVKSAAQYGETVNDSAISSNDREPYHLRVNDKGEIKSINARYLTTLGYRWEEIAGEPISRFRHPDNPQVAYEIFWSYVKRNKPAGMYFKNQRKDGQAFWVYAVACPIDDDVVITLFEPKSEFVNSIATLYKTFYLREQGEEHPEAGYQAEFNEAIKAVGYRGHEDFFSSALVSEIMKRDMGEAAGVKYGFDQMHEIRAGANELSDETIALGTDLQAMQTIPHNLRVIASRLEPTGGPISTLSENYGTVSREISSWFQSNIQENRNNFSIIEKSLQQGFFLSAIVSVLRDSNITKTYPMNASSGDHLRRVDAAAEKYAKHSEETFRRVGAETERILRACDVMKRHLMGLSSTRIMCKIEGVRLADGAEGLSEIIYQLKVFQDRISSRLEKIVNQTTKISRIELTYTR